MLLGESLMKTPTQAPTNIKLDKETYQQEHPSDSKDRQKKLEWASTLKREQLKKDETDKKESLQSAMTDSERMVDKPTTSQQAEMANEQQQPRRIVREYNVPHWRFGRQRTPPEKRYPCVPTVPITAQILPMK
uniref:Uncharacterized protein n=1 Tax=Romanomermis culicivorax TaxID=13658 RepID=A0A915JSX8_ROMCU